MFPAFMPDGGLVPGARPRTRSDRASQQGQDRIQAGSSTPCSASAAYVMPRARSHA
jgi:hypothetical protein